MIKIQVTGHLGKDATVNQANGQNVVNFNVAHTEKWKDKEGNAQERTTWVECNYWTEKLGVVPYLKKGTKVLVEGIPAAKGWQGKDGSIGSTLSARVTFIELLGSANETQRPSQDQAATGIKQDPAATQANQPVVEQVNDDLPF
jgi:single-strand DNA-binding protein